MLPYLWVDSVTHEVHEVRYHLPRGNDLGRSNENRRFLILQFSLNPTNHQRNDRHSPFELNDPGTNNTSQVIIYENGPLPRVTTYAAYPGLCVTAWLEHDSTSDEG